MTREDSFENEQESYEIEDLEDRDERDAAAPRKLNYERELKCFEDLDNGERCRVAPLRGEDFCINHSPSERGEQLRQRRTANSIAARQLAALETAGELGSSAGLRKIALRLIRGLAEGSFDTERARVMVAVMRMILAGAGEKERSWESIEEKAADDGQVGGEKAGG